METISKRPAILTQAVALIAAITICFSAAAVGGLATSSGLASWYQGLERPSWNPPNWIFGPVWTILYLMMASAAWLVWRESRQQKTGAALTIFMAQLVLNVLWSVIFFGLQQPGLAFVEIIVLWVSIAATLFCFAPISRLAAGLMVPYLLWVAFAAVLNFKIWSLN
jgi:benzodiazapine receptor